MLISTTKHSVQEPKEIEDYVDDFELGIGLEEKNRITGEELGEKNLYYPLPSCDKNGL